MLEVLEIPLSHTHKTFSLEVGRLREKEYISMSVAREFFHFLTHSDKWKNTYMTLQQDEFKGLFLLWVHGLLDFQQERQLCLDL